jgi:hypothetical protein
MHELSDPPQRNTIEEVDSHADLVATALAGHGRFDDLMAAAGAEYDALLGSVARLGPAYAFDRAGRPAAIDAVRAALPAVERELFEAILDDFACERAAIQEALYRVALARGRVRAERG